MLSAMPDLGSYEAPVLGAVGAEREKAGGLPDSTEEGRVCAMPSRLHQGPDSQTDVKFPDLLHTTTGTPDCEA